ncbi:hypothetical protein [Clostridium sp. BJN0001]|uniref:hypothetical protein n=1 Tax=Clostridium sp. BJN0001 TaxID=2930219 RepID=UPI001FD352CF|nr:hypothetical protein [Clostridium sp. BJN0001]
MESNKEKNENVKTEEIEKKNENVESKEVLKSEVIKDESASKNVKKKKCSFFNKLGIRIIDEFCTLGVSSLLLVLVDLIMRKLGYMFTMPAVMLIVFYFIVNALYMPIMHSTKLKRTIGELILKSSSDTK